MKLNAHNNPPINNGGKKAKGAAPAQSKPKHHDPARTEANKARRIAREAARQAAAKKRADEVMHGKARLDRRLNMQIVNEERHFLITHPEVRLSHTLAREELICQGLIKPRSTDAHN